MRSSFRVAYLVVANTAVLILVIVLGANAIYGFIERDRAFSYDMLPQHVRQSYAHMSPAEVTELLGDSDAMRFRFAPPAGFIEDTLATRFVNIDARGIRHNGGAAAPAGLDGTIWMLGGSTALGYGVADAETIPSQLERTLGQRVVNLGRRGYSSAIENRRFTSLLRAGYRPSLALFLDGINESCDVDELDEDMARLVTQSREPFVMASTRAVPALWARVRGKVRRMAGGESMPFVDALQLSCILEGRESSLREVHMRTMLERDALCQAYGIRCRTLVQPFAGLHGRHDDREFANGAGGDRLRRLFEHLQPSWQATHATFVTGALDGLPHHAFVSAVHYSAEASRAIAEAIAAVIR